MKIAILGAGPVGSAFAFQLARAGHDVTVVARGARLAYLEKERAIITVSGAPAPVEVSSALDPAVAWDIVLVTVLDSQVDAVLPALRDSAAKQVMFVFNTFSSLDRLRDAVGADRFQFGFPSVMAELKDGRLKAQFTPRSRFTPLLTTVTDAGWAETFSKAGIPTDTEADMVAWLRTHAALVAPVMVLMDRVYRRKSGLSWKEAHEFASAIEEGLDLVRSLGHRLTPASMETLGKWPRSAIASLLWAASRSAPVVALGEKGPGEARTLIDDMVAAAPERSAKLQALRPS